MANVVWKAPGAEAISEFARQSNGTYLHATCVETMALMCLIGQKPAASVPPSQIGNYLQQMVNTWRAANPGVSSEGASSYVDATRWLRAQGLQVDENVLSGSWWQELVTGIRDQHCVYGVGVTNAQGLPGDESGVHNHGLAALGIMDDGSILCGDPDNWRAQVNMPGNPIGAFVTYTEQDFINGQISSLTKVHPVSGGSGGNDMAFVKQPDGSARDDQTGVVLHLGMAAYVLSNDTQEHALLAETYYDANNSFVPCTGGLILTYNKQQNAVVTDHGGETLLAVWQALVAAKAAASDPAGAAALAKLAQIAALVNGK